MTRLHKLGIILFSGLLTLSVNLLPLQTHADGSLYQWYWNENFVNASGNMWSDSQGKIPTDHTYCFAYGMGAKQMNLGVNHDLTNYTGFYVPPDSRPRYQMGIDQSWPGSNTCQIYGTGMGFQLHKESIIANNPKAATGSIYGMQMIRNWGTDLSRKPWSSTYGSSPKLRVQANYTVPHRDTPTGVVQYGQIVVSLVDTTYTGPGSKAIWYAISLWDSRGQQPRNVHPDSAGTPNYIVDTYVGDTVYSTAHYNSQNIWGNAGCGCLWYGAYITKTNLINAVNDVNKISGRHYSTNPNDWAINLAGVGTEMYSPSGKLGWVGSRAWQLGVFTEQ